MVRLFGGSCSRDGADRSASNHFFVEMYRQIIHRFVSCCFGLSLRFRLRFFALNQIGVIHSFHSGCLTLHCCVSGGFFRRFRDERFAEYKLTRFLTTSNRRQVLVNLAENDSFYPLQARFRVIVEFEFQIQFFFESHYEFQRCFRIFRGLRFFHHIRSSSIFIDLVLVLSLVLFVILAYWVVRCCSNRSCHCLTSFGGNVKHACMEMNVHIAECCLGLSRVRTTLVTLC